MRKGFLLASLVLIASSARGEYTLKLSNGKYPAEVKIENLSGNLPLESWYKKGWTENGWTADDYGTSYKVALSPSHIEDGAVCENALTLPTLKIEDGEWLSWDGCEVYPVFSDSYTVEFREKDQASWTILGEFTESKSIWTTHMLDLSPYYGKEGEVRFVCRSTNGYMLALNDISIKTPTEYTFVSANETPKFFAVEELEDGKILASINIMNTGMPISSATIGINVEGLAVSSLQEFDYWPTGETRSFQIPLPLTPNVRADYAITIAPDNGQPQTLVNSFAYCTSFKRHLYVDKGTGMWCNACPNGTLTIEELEATYGDALIVGETHNKDLLANEIDFSWLKFYSIPHLQLNRVQSTKSDNASKFGDQICIPTEMEIKVSEISTNSNGNLSVKATVKTSESFAAADRKYRIGYLLTRNVSGSEDPRYYQKNVCTIAKQKQYRYLPSMMLSPMCYFPNVTIPSQLATLSENPAFTGIEGSLPEFLAPAEIYHSEWEIPLPEGFENFDGLRLVAYILDADSRVILNSTASYIDDSASVEGIADQYEHPGQSLIFTIDGRQIHAEMGSLLPGLYIINGKKVLIK